MNPTDWLKTAYGAFGSKHPTASLLVVMVVGALVFGAIWKIAAYKYSEASSKVSSTIPQPQNTTYGPESPIMPKNSGDVSITNKPAEDTSHPTTKEGKRHATKNKEGESP